MLFVQVQPKPEQTVSLGWKLREREREREGGDESPAFVLALGLFAGVFCSTVSIVLYVLHQTPKGSTHGIIQKIPYFLGAVVGLVVTFLFG